MNARLLILALGLLVSSRIAAVCASEDWSSYHLIPSSAPAFVLEAEAGGGTEGTMVTIREPSLEAAHQKWRIESREDGYVALRPAHAEGLVLSVVEGSPRNGARIGLEKDAGKPSQRWKLERLENESYALIPKHAPKMGLDHFGGKAVAGAQVDLWTFNPGDSHLLWQIRPLAGTGTKGKLASEGYPKHNLRPVDGAVLTGTLRQFVFRESKIFPGTVREVTVFVPAQYDGTKPACVYVKTDGFNPREKTLMETMIASGEMPVTVGVFVRPGEVPAPVAGTVGRRNRCFEYDSVNDNNVRFLVEELLPQVAREFSLKLSEDGNDRCLAGGSSGGIAAFTAAWNRPDAFSRVYAASGSWVAFRGGHEFPTMVRKFEAKPIRAFLTTATRDMENAAGDWFLLDQEMDKALKFSGYDYQFRVVDGRHVAGYMDYWPEAMAYLWKGWPQRVQAGPSSPRVQEILIPGENWKLVGEGYQSTRGPACNAAGEVYFADSTANQLHRINVEGRVEPWVQDAGWPHAVSVGADGTVYTVSEKSGRIMAYDSKGNGRVVLEGLSGHSILARPDGVLYVTSNGNQAHGPGSIWWIHDGQKKEIDRGIKFATGLACRPDQWLLSVAEGHSKWVYSYQIGPSGVLLNKERFFPLHVADWEDDAGAESLCYSVEGRQFVATRSGIQISADDGPTQVILPVPDGSRVTGVALGGRELDQLYAFCGKRIWKRRIQQHAAGAFTPWTPVKPNKL